MKVGVLYNSHAGTASVPGRTRATTGDLVVLRSRESSP